MKILTHNIFGFCKGVNKAVKTALEQNQGSCFTYGQLVHNSHVQAMLQQKGILAVETLEDLKEGDTLIIRAHGVGEHIYTDCEKRGIKIIDATCVFVKQLQNRARSFFQRGYQVVLIGDKNHAEIIGVNGWCCNSAIVTNGNTQLDLNAFEKVAILFQTTFKHDQMQKCLALFNTEFVKTLEIIDTICYTTKQRQEIAVMLAQRSDCVVVVGDEHSANCNSLIDTAKGYCKDVRRITDSSEIKPENFTDIAVCSILAGASTPRELIKEVVWKMSHFAKDNDFSSGNGNVFTEYVNSMPEKRRPLSKGMKLKGTVSLINDEGVHISVGNKKDGLIPNEEITAGNDYTAAKAGLKVGDVFDVLVLSTDKQLTLSKKAIEIMYKDDALVEGIKGGKEFSIAANKAVTGGLLGKLGSYTVFVPASHIRDGYVSNLEQYVGKKLRLIALPDGVDEAKHKIAASQRELLKREKKEKDDNFWNNIEVGEIVEGKVLRFAPFGAFVSVRGFDCLAHVSDLSYMDIKNASDVLELNKSYEFVVLKLDREANRVSIGYKQLQRHPWEEFAAKYAPGEVVTGKVARIVPFGAFIDIGNGIDGLLHISEVSWEWLSDINRVLKVGDEIEVIIKEFDIDHKKVTLSRKQLLEQPAEMTQREEKE